MNTQPAAISIQIIVLKTKIETESELRQLSDLLTPLDSVLKWTVDREDSDKVLRIETINTSTSEIMDLLAKHEIYCEELPD